MVMLMSIAINIDGHDGAEICHQINCHGHNGYTAYKRHPKDGHDDDADHGDGDGDYDDDDDNGDGDSDDDNGDDDEDEGDSDE